jgi:hypothetical protein
VTEFLERRQVRLPNKTFPNRFYLPPAEWHRNVANRYTGVPAGEWDLYGLRHTATHLAQAARASSGLERHENAEALVRLTSDPQFRSEHMTRLHDLPRLQRDLQESLTVAALDTDAAGLPLVVESALALVGFRRNELRPEPLFELAFLGNIDAAAQRLALFDVDHEWQQILLATIAWLSLGANSAGAKALRDRVAGMQPLSLRAARLIGFFDAASGTGQALAPGLPLPEPPQPEVAEAIVARMGGSGGVAELLAAHGIPEARNPSLRANEGYLSQHDGPYLVSFAAANPAHGGRLLLEYIAIHTNYQYLEYRNRSLAFLLDSVLNHYHDWWVRNMAVQISSSALAGSRSDFQEALPCAVLAVRAGSDAQAFAALRAAGDQALEAAAGLASGRLSDPLARTKRQLAALAESFWLLGRDGDCAALVQQSLPILARGFAGFSAPACLTLAETIELTQASVPDALKRALEAALGAAHNVQDPLFCARITARVNAMRAAWWEKPFDLPATVEQFCKEPDGAEFCPTHLAGEKFDQRSPEGMGLTYELSTAGTLEQIEKAFGRRPGEVAALNPGLPRGQALERGTPVRIPDPGFATWLAARFAGAALANTTLARGQRTAIIRSLVPLAAANPTALDTVLARLLLAERPAAAEMLAGIEELAKAAMVPPPALEAALPA